MLQVSGVGAGKVILKAYPNERIVAKSKSKPIPREGL